MKQRSLTGHFRFLLSLKIRSILVVAVISLVSSQAWSQPQEQDPEDTESRQRSAEIFRFIRNQLPELEEPLRALRRKNPDQFNEAMQSLNESYMKLQQLKETGNETAYKRALENWTFNANIQMLTAQLSIEDNAGLRRQLRRVLIRQYNARLQHQKSERDRYAARVEQLNNVIDRLETNREDTIQRRLESLLRTSERNRRLRERSKNQSSSD